MESRANPNVVYLRGNLGRDPELKEFGGNCKANFSLGVNNRWTGKNGEENVETLWIDCEFWNDKAREVVDQLKKGSYIELEGKLVLDQWDDKNSGQRRFKHYIKAFDFQIPQKREDNNSSTPKKRGRPKKKDAEASVNNTNSEDIPF